ncbi:MAG: hypothetical protein WC834_04330 [Eubacteriales bacterium]
MAEIMEKDRDKQPNRSYLYRLNEELSGQAELDPYFISSAVTGGETPTMQEEYDAPENNVAENDDAENDETGDNQVDTQ